MLSELFSRFIQESATTVMARAVLERMLPHRSSWMRGLNARQSVNSRVSGCSRQSSG